MAHLLDNPQYDTRSLVRTLASRSAMARRGTTRVKWHRFPGWPKRRRRPTPISLQTCAQAWKLGCSNPRRSPRRPAGKRSVPIQFNK